MSTVVKVAKWLFEHKDFASALDVSEAIGVDLNHVSKCFLRILDSKHYRVDFRWRKSRSGLGRKVRHLKITEIIIRYRDREYGSTQISRFRHGWLLIRMSLFAARKIKFI